MEGLYLVGSKKVPGYELLTCLGMDREGHLTIGYAHLFSYKEKGFKSLSHEVEQTLQQAKKRLGA